jgi:hypothetical protein
MMEITMQNIQAKSRAYKEYREKQETYTSQVIKKYCIYFIAGSEQELKKQMLAKGYKPEQLVPLGAGAYCLKEHEAAVDKMFDKVYDDKKKYLADPDNFYGALYYELWNNEYYYNADNKAIADALLINECDIVATYPDANKVVNLYVSEMENIL